MVEMVDERLEAANQAQALEEKHRLNAIERIEKGADFAGVTIADDGSVMIHNFMKRAPADMLFALDIMKMDIISNKLREMSSQRAAPAPIDQKAEVPESPV